MRSLLIIAALSVATALPASALPTVARAGQPVSLKADTVSSDGTVTLGDIFDGAGAAGRVAVAARTGASVVLDAAQLQAFARRAGLDWANPEGLHKIVVRGAASGAAVGGRAGNVEVLTYARSLAAGEIVQPTDLVWTKLAAAPSDAPADPEAMIGQVAKRPLREGAPAMSRDVGAAIVIKPGDIMTVTYEADGISLALQGKAMTAAGVGETVSVQNTTSKKIIQAVVTAPGQAVVGPAAETLKSRPVRYAVR